MRFKRPVFGVNGAFEQLQCILPSVLADMTGSLNIVDDTFIYRKNKHEKTLEAVCFRLAYVGFTLNFWKCIFVKDILEYFGYIFWKNGIKYSLKNVSVQKDNQRPTNKNLVQSFLGLTNYLKIIIRD